MKKALQIPACLLNWVGNSRIARSFLEGSDEGIRSLEPNDAAIALETEELPEGLETVLCSAFLLEHHKSISSSATA